MGVQSLWDILGPAARPVKLEALSRKKLAVDASIWIYQFLRAVRDKEGNALGQSHIVGFFRRICKMLYFGILPLFVFDGGAPALKRKVILARKERREGNLGTVQSTAQKLLAMQMQRKRSPGPKKGRTSLPAPRDSGQSAAGTDDNVTYFDDLPQNLQSSEEFQNKNLPNHRPEAVRKDFRKKDEYHLPELLQFTIKKNDGRIMPEGEFEEYTENSSWDYVDGISIDSVDPSSTAFAELPLATQYMILNHLRLRLRLRLGYTKDQLQNLFPNSKDFSKFQVQQVQKRNFYTQRLMNVSGTAEDTGNVTKRIAGDKDRQYMLVKNEGGWTLSLGQGDNEVVELDEQEIANAKLIPDQPAANAHRQTDPQSDSDSDIFEDVPLKHEEPEPDRREVENYDDNIVEQIYSQFSHEFEDDVKIAEENDQNIHKFDEAELKRAIEESKSDYYRQVSEEKKLKKTVKDVAQNQNFEFGQSLLAPEALQEVSDEVVNVTASDPEDEPRNDAAQSMPAWFENSKRFEAGSQNFSAIGVLSDPKPSQASEGAQKEGLISWGEAQEYMKAQNESKDDSDSDVEILEHPSKYQNGSRGMESEQGNQKKSKFSTQVSGDSGTFLAGPEGANGSLEAVRLIENEPDANNGCRTSEAPPLPAQVPNANASRIGDRLPENSFNAEKAPRSAADADLASTDARKQENQAQILEYDFHESEEQALQEQLSEEEREHDQFTTRILMDKIPIHTTVTREQLLQEQLQKAKRDAEEVTQTMINDVQELLKRFGIPYITAPMEAEAQCAELYRLGLVDGIITDDSDCFLFGGSRVYKNMFNQKQYVECYIAEDIEGKLGLKQRNLIELALLLGSDYTEGVKGVGPVLAMEILAEFENLTLFKKWFDNTTKSLSRPQAAQNAALEKTLLARIKNGSLFLPDNFPDPIIVNAYERPEVDRDGSAFKWGVPLLDQIRSFLMYNVGWNQERVDEVMIPLIRIINRTRTEGTQSTLGEFFPQEYISHRKDVGLGKRMKLAAAKLKEH